MSDNLYPVIKTEDEVKELINKNLNIQRAQKIIDKINDLQKALERYKKVGNRWKKTGKAIRIINVTLSSLIAGSVCILGILTTQGVIVPILLMGLLGGYSAVETAIMEGINVGNDDVGIVDFSGLGLHIVSFAGTKFQYLLMYFPLLCINT